MNDSTYLKIIKYHRDVVYSLVGDSIDIKTTLFMIEELWAAGNLDSYNKANLNDLDNLYKIKERRYNRLNNKPNLRRYKKGWKRRRLEFIEFNKQF